MSKLKAIRLLVSIDTHKHTRTHKLLTNRHSQTVKVFYNIEYHITIDPIGHLSIQHMLCQWYLSVFSFFRKWSMCIEYMSQEQISIASIKSSDIFNNVVDKFTISSIYRNMQPTKWLECQYFHISVEWFKIAIDSKTQ